MYIPFNLVIPTIITTDRLISVAQLSSIPIMEGSLGPCIHLLFVIDHKIVFCSKPYKPTEYLHNNYINVRPTLQADLKQYKSPNLRLLI